MVAISEASQLTATAELELLGDSPSDAELIGYKLAVSRPQPTHAICSHCRVKTIYYRAAFDIDAKLTVI